MSIDLGPGLIEVCATVPGVVPAVVVPVAGSPGPQGPSGTSLGFEYAQTTAAASWAIAVPAGLGRRPCVSLYVAGELVDADVIATSSQVTVSFPSPVAGTAVLT